MDFKSLLDLIEGSVQILSRKYQRDFVSTRKIGIKDKPLLLTREYNFGLCIDNKFQ